MFSLSRIRNIGVTDKCFEYRAAEDFRSHTGGSYFGAYSGEKTRRFRIAFFNDGAMRVYEHRWTRDQGIEETADGIVLTFSSSQYGKVLELVLANGGDALPLEPEELVQDWREHLKRMREREKSLNT